MSINEPASVSGSGTGNWKEQKAKLKAKFPALTDADLNYEEGKKEAMMTKLQTTIGKTRSELDKIIAEL